MGRYRRPSTCRYCYETGHTQRSCPVMKKDAETGNAYAQDKIESYAHKAKSRKCSYCRNEGHNKKGCTTRKEHGKLYHQILDEFTTDMTTRCNAVGIKIGSLVTVGQRDSAPVVAVIESLEIKGTPDYHWLNEQFCIYDSKQKEEQAVKYNAFNRFVQSMSGRLPAPNLFMRSLTGKGLGYWADCGASRYDVCDVLRSVERKEPMNTKFTVISAA